MVLNLCRLLNDPKTVFHGTEMRLVYKFGIIVKLPRLGGVRVWAIKQVFFGSVCYLFKGMWKLP